jgi:hypothetical protein
VLIAVASQWSPVMPAIGMITVILFYVEVLRLMHTQIFRDHAPGLPDLLGIASVHARHIPFLPLRA